MLLLATFSHHFHGPVVSKLNHNKQLQCSVNPDPHNPLHAAASNAVVRAPTFTMCRDIFPLTLHTLLANPTVSDIISWLPHGRSFVILQPEALSNSILPRYFAHKSSSGHHPEIAMAPNVAPVSTDVVGAGMHKYQSFRRKLNWWGLLFRSRTSLVERLSITRY